MAMSWSAALGSMDDSLESLLARRKLENAGLLDIAQQQEHGRHARRAESLQERQIDEMAASRAEQIAQRREAQKALDEQRRAAAAKATEEAARESMLRKQLEGVANGTIEATPQERQAARFKLMGITPTADIQTGRDRAAEATTAQAAALNRALSVIEAQTSAKRALTEEKRTADDPKLPAGVQAYLMSMQARGYTLPQARAELSKTWGKLVNEDGHHNLSLEATSKALNNLYTQPNEDRIVDPAEAETVQVQTPKGDIVPVPKSQLADAIAAGGKVVQ